MYLYICIYIQKHSKSCGLCYFLIRQREETLDLLTELPSRSHVGLIKDEIAAALQPSASQPEIGPAGKSSARRPSAEDQNHDRGFLRLSVEALNVLEHIHEALCESEHVVRAGEAKG